MKKILKVLGTTIALTAIGAAMRANSDSKTGINLHKDSVKIKAPKIEINGSLLLK